MKTFVDILQTDTQNHGIYLQHRCCWQSVSLENGNGFCIWRSRSWDLGYTWRPLFPNILAPCRWKYSWRRILDLGGTCWLVRRSSNGFQDRDLNLTPLQRAL